GLRGEAGRDGHAVAGITQAGATHRYVHGDQERVEARLGGAVHQRHGPVAVLPHVQLEPVAAGGVGLGDILDRAGAHGGQGIGDTDRRGGGGAGDLSFGLRHAGGARGCNAGGKGGRPTENGGGGVHVGDVAQDSGVELDVLEGLPRPVQGEFALGGAVGVVERGLRGAQLGDPAQVLDRVGGSKTAPACVQVWLLELQQWSEIAHFRDSTLDHRYYSSALTG